MIKNKIVIHDGRVNDGTNNDSPGPGWVPKLVYINSSLMLNLMRVFLSGSQYCWGVSVFAILLRLQHVSES